MQVTFSIRAEDTSVLKQAAKDCGVSLNMYLKEVVECKAADLRNEAALAEETNVSLHR